MKAAKNMDVWGTTTSLLCAIHCAALPLLLSLGFISRNSWLVHPLFEIIILGMTAVFVYFSIVKKYLRDKEDIRPVLMAIIGAMLVVLHHFLPLNGTFLVVSGGSMIALAHVANLRIGGHSH
jgi:hypothetical protein